MKKMVLFYLLLSFVSLYAIDSKLALELARSKKIGVVVERVNTIYDYINLYAMETASTPTDMSALTTKYSGITTGGFEATQNISFSITNNIVTFSNVVPSNLSNIVKQVYKNSPNLHQFAIVNPSTLTMSIRLKPETIQFLTNSNIIRTSTLVAGTVSVQDTAPSCSGSAMHGNVWYRPDAVGGYLISLCETSNSWKQIANKPNIAIYRSTIGALSAIKAPIGTKGYAENGGQIWEYIYNGTAWVRVVD